MLHSKWEQEKGGQKTVLAFDFKPRHNNVWCSFLLCSFCFCFVFSPPSLYSSDGFNHGKRRCPRRSAQPESVFDGRSPEEVWILKRPVLPRHLAAHSKPPLPLNLLPRCFFSCLLSPRYFQDIFILFFLLSLCLHPPLLPVLPSTSSLIRPRVVSTRPHLSPTPAALSRRHDGSTDATTSPSGFNPRTVQHLDRPSAEKMLT